MISHYRIRSKKKSIRSVKDDTFLNLESEKETTKKRQIQPYKSLKFMDREKN